MSFRYTLYYGGCAAVARMALEEVGADYDVVPIDLASGRQRSADYLAVNPKGRVPALATPDGVLTENMAILLYLAQSFPEARLAPLGDAWRLARMTAFNSFIASSVHVTFSTFGRPERYADDPAAQAAMRAKGPVTLREHFNLIDRELAEGPWVLGDTFSTADIYLTFFSRGAAQFDWAASQRNVAAHLQRMKARPSYAAVYGEA
jgi:glutathione S-transferase